MTPKIREVIKGSDYNTAHYSIYINHITRKLRTTIINDSMPSLFCLLSFGTEQSGLLHWQRVKYCPGGSARQNLDQTEHQIQQTIWLYITTNVDITTYNRLCAYFMGCNLNVIWNPFFVIERIDQYIVHTCVIWGHFSKWQLTYVLLSNTSVMYIPTGEIYICFKYRQTI